MENSITSQAEMPWLTKKVDYEGFPLLLRRPNHKRIRQYQKEYFHLFCLTHTLEKVTNNGLPELEYFDTLIDFDGILVDLFELETEGITLLVETYCGKRNYWFYLKDGVDYLSKFNKLCDENFDKNLEYTIRKDNEWSFIEKYPLAFKGFTKNTLWVIFVIIILFVLLLNTL